jgi:hypothetical protein
VSGSGASYTVADAGTTTFAPGSRVRMTIQCRLLSDELEAPRPIGLAATYFSAMGSGTAGGVVARSQLCGVPSGADSQAKGEAFGLPAGFVYPGMGAVTSPTVLVRTGLHAVYRDVLFDPDGAGPLTVDSNPANGTYQGDDILNMNAFSFARTPFETPIVSTETAWNGMFSFEFTHSGALGVKTFQFVPTTDAQLPNGAILYWDENFANPQRAFTFTNGSITLTFIPAPACAVVFALGGLVANRRCRQV